MTAKRTHLDVIQSSTALEPYLSAWTELAPTPLQSPDWLLSWWDAFQSANARLSVLCITHEDQCIGLAPFFIRDSWVAGKSIRFLGSGRACTDFQTILSHPGYEQEVADAVADWLLDSNAQVAWESVDLEGSIGTSQTLEFLMQRLRQFGCTTQRRELERTWRLDMDGGWDGFMQRLSKNHRKQNRNLINRLDKQDQLSFRFETQADRIQDALEVCMDLHQKHWTSQGEPGCFSDPRFVQFLQNACQRFAEREQVAISILEIEGHPVASQLFLLDDQDNWFVYQSGRDPAFDEARVGRILNLASIRHAGQLGVKSIDYLRGDEVYKSRLRAEPSECLLLRAVPPTKIPQLRHAARNLGENLKSGAKSLGGMTALGAFIPKPDGYSGSSQSQ